MHTADMPPTQFNIPQACSPATLSSVNSGHLASQLLRPLDQHSLPRPLNDVFGPVSVRYETTRLEGVIIGHPTQQNYNPKQANPINRRSLCTIKSETHIPLDHAMAEFHMFRRALESHGVAVASPPGRDFKDQIYTRDPCGVIGDTLVLARMATQQRAPEAHALLDLIFHLRENHIGSVKVAPPFISGKPVYFEFGDIFTHGDTIYIGLSQRTNQAAVQWFQREFGSSHRIQAFKLKEPDTTQEALHLDCAFNLAGAKDKPVVLIHLDSFEDPDSVLQHFTDSRIIEVTSTEQDEFATNCLSLDESTVIVRDRCERVADQLEKSGISTIRLPFDAAAAQGGLFRCCSMPLVRH